ncbi:MAG: hypothetical protein P1U40_02250 [Coxiellaceae bacterium]|nr:hypothetical protein [Coxiellaceae bacterium]
MRKAGVEPRINLFLDLSVIINVEETPDDSAQYWSCSPCAGFFNSADKKVGLSASQLAKCNVFFLLPVENFAPVNEYNTTRLLFLQDWLYRWPPQGILKRSNCHLLFYNHLPSLNQPLWHAHARIAADGRLDAFYRGAPRGWSSPTKSPADSFVVTEKEYIKAAFTAQHVHRFNVDDSNRLTAPKSLLKKMQAAEFRLASLSVDQVGSRKHVPFKLPAIASADPAPVASVPMVPHPPKGDKPPRHRRLPSFMNLTAAKPAPPPHAAYNRHRLMGRSPCSRRPLAPASEAVTCRPTC